MPGSGYGERGVRVSPTPGDVTRPGDRLLHDSAAGPARNPERRKCERCGKRRKHCRCERLIILPGER